MDEFVTNVSSQAIKTALLLASPMLLSALFMGILVSLFQAVTQINEQTMSFIPKIIVIIGAIVICAPWMSDTIINFTTELYTSIPQVVTGR